MNNLTEKHIIALVDIYYEILAKKNGAVCTYENINTHEKKQVNYKTN